MYYAVTPSHSVSKAWLLHCLRVIFFMQMKIEWLRFATELDPKVYRGENSVLHQLIVINHIIVISTKYHSNYYYVHDNRESRGYWSSKEQQTTHVYINTKRVCMYLYLRSVLCQLLRKHRRTHAFSVEYEQWGII